MDDLVKQALAKWPNVPDCHGWLALDARGQWRIGTGTGNERQTITHSAIIDFINRNYMADDQGRWLFQNGPQRVYVELAYTPYVWRLHPKPKDGWELRDHTSTVAAQIEPVPSGIWLDSEGRFLIQADARIGVVHDHDSFLLADWLCDGNGVKLYEAALSEKIEALMNESKFELYKKPESIPLLWMRWLNDDRRILPLGNIAPEQVAARFGFSKNPG